ncbi:hypothetical protein HDV05_006613 [Chytridiales sp. JEL 0842]|nr:hypothetical protein HDV05_006613 [Chytridiales sp. JEL 0842]
MSSATDQPTGTPASSVPAPETTPPPPSTANLDKPLRIHPAGLSSIERIFYKSPPSKPQVLICFVARFSCPSKIPTIHPARIVDILRISGAQHYRLSSYIDPVSCVVKPLAKNAKELPVNYRFVARKSVDSWREALHDEVNTNFEVAGDVKKPLWRSCIILPQELVPTSGPLLDNSQPFLPSSNETRDRLKNIITSESLTTKGFDYKPIGSQNNYFEIIFTFHHCLGDGLSAFSFCRTFSQFIDDTHMNAEFIDLESVKVSDEPPVNFDSLFNPWLVEVIPVAFGMAFNTLLRKNKMRKRLKASKAGGGGGAGHTREASISSNLSNNTTTAKKGNEGVDAESPVTPTSLRSVEVAGGNPYTRTRGLYFDADFMSTLRTVCRTNKTTVSSLLLVIALCATRTYFASSPKYTGRKIPNHQGWVCTTSLRHLLPNSTLMKGGHRETDPSVKIFGGYAGSIASDSFKILDTSNIWERSRAASRALRVGYRTSIGRMKLVNYLYRRPQIWERIQARTDLSKFSRRYSIEVANLGAWDNPAGEPGLKGEEENKLMLDHWYGTASAAFDGVRALFSLGSLTVNGRMGMGISYDATVVSEEEADIFLRAFTEGLKKAGEAGKRATVGEIRQ